MRARTNVRYWDELAKVWTLRPPLCPGPEDSAWFEARLAATQERRRTHALILGVTPALAALPWHGGTTLLALDWSERMLAQMGERFQAPPRALRIRGDWRAPPLKSGSVDIIVGDGCYTALESEEDALAFTREMHRMLRPDGEAWFRCFVLPQPRESVHSLAEEAKHVPSMEPHLFRWRLLMCVHGGSRWAVPLGEVGDAWQSIPNRMSIARRHGWTRHDVQRLEAWKNEKVRYAFPSLETLRRLVDRWFEVESITFGDYELSRCFPRIVLKARA